MLSLSVWVCLHKTCVTSIYSILTDRKDTRIQAANITVTVVYTNDDALFVLSKTLALKPVYANDDALFASYEPLALDPNPSFIYT